MKTELYHQWIQSRQAGPGDIDVADAVMEHITQKADRPHLLKRTWETILLDGIQARGFVRACVLASGAIMGLFRMFMQIYSALFI